MIRVIAIIVLAVFFPMQLYAVNFGEFDYKSNTENEYFVPRGPDNPQGQRNNELSEKILEGPPKTGSAEISGTNWWLWGGLGLAATVVGLAAIAVGGSKSGGSANSGGGLTTTTVTGSW